MPTESTLDSLTRRLEELEIEAKTIKDTVEALKIAQVELKGKVKVRDRVRILNLTFFPYLTILRKTATVPSPVYPRKVASVFLQTTVREQTVSRRTSLNL